MNFDVQIATKRVAEELGKNLLIVKTSWNSLIPALTSGKIDMIIAGMSPTAERKKRSPSQRATIPVNRSCSFERWKCKRH